MRDESRRGFGSTGTCRGRYPPELMGDFALIEIAATTGRVETQHSWQRINETILAWPDTRLKP